MAQRSGGATNKELHNMAKQMLADYLHEEKRFSEAQANTLANDEIKFEDAKDWVAKKQKSAAPKTEASSSSSSKEPTPKAQEPVKKLSLIHI